MSKKYDRQELERFVENNKNSVFFPFFSETLKKKEGWKKAVFIALAVLTYLIALFPLIIGMLSMVTACSNYDWFSEEWVEALKWPALLIGMDFLLLALIEVGHIVIRALVKNLQAQLMTLDDGEKTNPNPDFNPNPNPNPNPKPNPKPNPNPDFNPNPNPDPDPGEYKTKEEVLEYALKFTTTDGMRGYLKTELSKLSLEDREHIQWLIGQPNDRIRNLAEKILSN